MASTTSTLVVSTMLIASVKAAAVGTFPDFKATIDQWPSQWNTSACSDQLVAKAECAELTTGFELDTESDGTKFLWAPEPGGDSSAHTACNPLGKPTFGNDANCGQAVFRIYCHSDAVVSFSGYGKGANGNDDSFWSWIDKERFSHMNGFRKAYGIARVPGNGWAVKKGEHALVLSEREDGTKLASVGFLSGYPICHFGVPGTSRSVQDELNKFSAKTGESILALENQADANTVGVTANANNITATNDAATTLGDLVATMSTQLSTNTAEMSIRKETNAATVSGLNDQISALQDTVNKLTNKLQVKVADFSVSAGSTKRDVPSVGSNNKDISIEAPQGGSVTVTDGTCSGLNLCEMGQQIKSITEQLNAEL